MSSEKIAVLAGPTASGKTDIAIALAERLGGEIVSADSQQVYRGFDLGTAKPTATQLARVRHHLISVVEPADRMDAARFAREATAAIADIHARGKPVLVVGGSGLYLRALIFGVVAGPERDVAYREQLEQRAREVGRATLHAELAALDPESAAKIQKQDLVRIVRALEIHHVTGQPASQVRAAHGFAKPRYEVWARLLTPPRDELYRRIDQRARAMFAGGLLDEVRALIAAGFANAPPMASIGYAQARNVVEGRWSTERAIADLAQSTRHYAKRQLTWFRKEPWLSPVSEPRVDELAPEWKAFLARPPGAE